MTMMHTEHRSYVHEQLSIQVLHILENQSGDGKVEFKEFKVRITISSIIIYMGVKVWSKGKLCLQISRMKFLHKL